MAIVPLLKIALLGETQRRDEVFRELQEFGELHLISSVASDVRMPSFRTTRAYEAYLYLKSSPEKRRQVIDEPRFVLDEIVDETIAIRDRTLDLEEEKLLLHRRIKALEPWGDFEFCDLNGCGDLKLWFYMVPLRELAAVSLIDYVWQCVHRDNRFAYVVVIASQEPDGMPVPRIHTGNRSLSWLTRRVQEVEESLEDLYWRRVGLTRCLTLLARQLAHAADLADIDRAKHETFDDGRLFAVEAWIPEGAIDQLRQFAMSRDLLFTAEQPSEDEQPPTLLANPPAWASGQELVHFYTTPGYTMWDPSGMVLVCFVLFFSMIVADAGYGLVITALIFIFRRRLRAISEAVCRITGLLAAGTVVYGVLCGSYFGVTPPDGSLPALLAIIDLGDQDMMMKLSVIVGVVHISIALAAKSMYAADQTSSLPNVGWLAILAAGLLMWLAPAGEPGVTLRWFAWGGLGSGALLVFCFSSQRLWRQGGVKERLLYLADGLLALAGVSKIFGDVLSYLRLFALGLASSQLAMTFNLLARESIESVTGVGTLLAILILCVGHGLNLLLALMSGVVHGLRLNFIEFFNWGLAEDGKPFKPFARRRIGLWNQLS